MNPHGCYLHRQVSAWWWRSTKMIHTSEQKLTLSLSSQNTSANQARQYFFSSSVCLTSACLSNAQIYICGQTVVFFLLVLSVVKRQTATARWTYVKQSCNKNFRRDLYSVPYRRPSEQWLCSYFLKHYFDFFKSAIDKLWVKKNGLWECGAMGGKLSSNGQSYRLFANFSLRVYWWWRGLEDRLQLALKTRSKYM